MELYRLGGGGMKTVLIFVEDDLVVREIQSLADVDGTCTILAQALVHCLYRSVEKKQDRFIICMGQIAAAAINHLDNLAQSHHRVLVRCKGDADAKTD